MTKRERDEARVRCVAATPKPWIEYEELDYYQGGKYLINGKNQVCRIEPSSYFDGNLEFIKHARTDLPKALDALERCVEMIGKLCEHYNTNFSFSICPICHDLGQPHDETCELKQLLKDLA